MISYAIGPNPRFLARDVSGVPLSGGFMYTYKNDDRSTFKAVYQDPAGQIPWDNPIQFGGDGVIDGPVYYADDEPYYIEIRNRNNNLVYSFEGYSPPSGGGGGGTVNIGIQNRIINGQFRFIDQEEILPNDFPANAEFQIAPYWFFLKTNNSATDAINFLDFALGESSPAEATPVKFIRYTCTVAGSGESRKDIFTKFGDVRSFENSPISFSCEIRATSGAGQVSLIVEQNFGTGGSPTAPIFTNIGNITLSGSYQKFSQSFTVPAVGGNTLGDNGDDYWALILRIPVDTAITIEMTNVQFLPGNIVPPYPRLTKEMENALLVAAEIPDVNSSDIGSYITVDSAGSWGKVSKAGTIIPYGGLRNQLPFIYLPADGTPYRSAIYPNLARVLGYSSINPQYLNGYGIDTWPCFNEVDSLYVYYSKNVTITRASDGLISTGFTFSAYTNVNLSPHFTGDKFNADFGFSESYLLVRTIEAGTVTLASQTSSPLTVLSSRTRQISTDLTRMRTFMQTKNGASTAASSYVTLHRASDNAAVNFWFEVDGGGSGPGGNEVKVPILTDFTKESVSLALLGAICEYQSDKIDMVAATSMTPGCWFNLYNSMNQYYVWYTISGAGVDPKPAGKTGIRVNILTSDTAKLVAQKTRDQLRRFWLITPNLTGLHVSGRDLNAVPLWRTNAQVIGQGGTASLQMTSNLEHFHTYNSGKSEDPGDVADFGFDNEEFDTSTDSVGSSEAKPYSFIVDWVIHI